MPIRLPDRIKRKSVITAVLTAVSAVMILGGSVLFLVEAVDVQLRCDRTADRCVIQRAGWFRTTEASWRIREMTDVSVLRPPKMSPTVEIVIFTGGTLRVESFGLDDPTAGQAVANLDELRAGRVDVVMIDAPRRAGLSIGAALCVVIGSALALLSWRELRARRRRASPAAGPSPADPAAVEREIEKERARQAPYQPTVDAVAPLVGEPIQAVGWMRLEAAARSSLGWPRIFCLAVTASRVVAVEVAFGIRSSRGVRVLAAWDRSTLHVAAYQSPMVTRSMVIEAPGWPTLALIDCTSSNKRSDPTNDYVYRLLCNDVIEPA